MKVFITGTTGHALEHFVKNGHEVQALVRPHHLKNLPDRPDVTWVGGSFADVFLMMARTALN